MDRLTRRSALASAAAVAAGVAGCAGVPDGDGDATAGEQTASDAPPATGTPSRAELRRRIGELEARSERAATAATAAPEFDEGVVERAREVAREARRAVVATNTGGAGWVLDADAGHVVTNAHVVSDVGTITVEAFDGTTRDAELLGADGDGVPDVALLRADLDAPELPTGSRSDLERGQPLVAVGHPTRVGEWVVSLGRFERYEPTPGWVLSTVPTADGNSGGPLLTLDGEVVGTVSGTTATGEGADRSKPDEVFTEFPEPEVSTTSVPIGTVRDSVAAWD